MNNQATHSSGSYPPQVENESMKSILDSALSQSPTLNKLKEELKTFDGQLCIVCRSKPIEKQGSMYCSLQCGVAKSKQVFASLFSNAGISLPPSLAGDPKLPKTRAAQPPPSPSADKARSPTNPSPTPSNLVPKRPLTPSEEKKVTAVKAHQSRIREFEAMLKRLDDAAEVAVTKRKELEKPNLCLFPYELFDEKMNVILSATQSSSEEKKEENEVIMEDVDTTVADVQADKNMTETNEIPSTEEESTTEDSSVCMFEGRCPRHEGWIITKTKTLELQIEEETRNLKEGLYQIMQSRLQKSTQSHNG